MTQCAVLSNKYNKFLYNDYDKLVYLYFKKAVNGEYKNEKRVITREDFFELKDSDPYVKFCWSFGNKGRTYLYGKEIEEVKLTACNMIMVEDWHKRFEYYRKFVKMLNKNNDGRNELQSLEILERLQSLELTNMSYLDYEYQDGDVVYCDPPYENTAGYSGNEFDSKQFYEWVKTRNYQVFFSSYEISDDSFYKVKLKSIAKIMCDNKNKTDEYLYSNRKFMVD